MNGETPLVSICVLAYNHESYLRKALDSFLSQKTDFPIEIVIHDDASTDGTAAIIREYEARYPDIMRPLYQEKNQYSTGIRNISAAFNFPRARGKYIAFCEGDDYWTSDDKLQKQVDVMRENPDCALCVHAAESVSEDGRYLEDIRPYGKTGVIPPEEVVLERVCYPSASMLFPTEYVQQLPTYYQNAPVGDIPLHLYLGTRGSVYYLDEKMSAYRQGAPTSWHADINQQDREKKIAKVEEHCRGMVRMYQDYNSSTGGIHQKEVDIMLRRLELYRLRARGDYKEILLGGNFGFLCREFIKPKELLRRFRSMLRKE